MTNRRLQIMRFPEVLKVSGPGRYPRSLELVLYTLAPAVTVLTAPLLARSLGVVERGQYGIAMAVTAFALTVGAWGQAEIYASTRSEEAVRLSSHSFIALTGGLVAGGAVFALLAMLQIPTVVAAVAAASVPVLNQANLWRAVSVVDGNLKAPAISSALNASLRLVLLWVGYCFALVNLPYAVVVTQCCLAIACLVLYWSGSWRRKLKGSIYRSTRQLLRAGSTVILFDIANAVFLRSDLIMLQVLSSPEQVGLFAVPASLTTAALALSIGAKSRIQKEIAGGADLRDSRREIVFVSLLGVAVATVLAAGAPFITAVMFGSDYLRSARVLAVLAISIPFVLLYDIALGVLIALGLRGKLLLSGWTSAGVQLVGLSVLCPSFGALGAAWSCIGTFSMSAALAWWLVLRRVQVSNRLP